MKAQNFNRSEIFTLAWQFVKCNGFTMAEALRLAWRNIKLRARLYKGITQFFFKKVNGKIRQAFGTLKSDLLTPTSGSGRRPNNAVQVYFDTEKNEYRCFKKCNLVKVL